MSGGGDNPILDYRNDKTIVLFFLLNTLSNFTQHIE